MVDMLTHRILDMIDSRECEDVQKWLQKYPNIQVVSRDGSITYRNAIKAAHPIAVQISDRFHLLKNLTSYGIEYLKKKLKSYVLIETTCKEKSNKDEDIIIDVAGKNRKLTLKEKYERIEELLLTGKCKTEICKSINMDVRAYDKLISMTPDERSSKFQTKLMGTHEEKLQLKIQRINNVRDLKKIGYSNREISRRTGINTCTIRNYLDENYSPVHASYGKKRKGLLSPYLKEIDSCLEKGLMGSIIERNIREKGYKGSSSSLRHYLSDWKKRRKHHYDKSQESGRKTETIERKNIFKLLFHPIEKVKSISQDKFNRICIENPCFEKIHNITWEFKKLLIDKKPDELNFWIEKAKKLGVEEISSFVSGLERDLDAVKNAIRYNYNNGLAEGSVNKLKVIKRVMYGRCSFETLRTKILKLESLRLFN